MIHWGGVRLAVIGSADSILIGNASSCITNEWNGTVNNAWENAANWSCGTVPAANTVVYINSNKPRYPFINSIAVCLRLYTAPAVSVIVSTGFKLDIKGNN